MVTFISIFMLPTVLTWYEAAVSIQRFMEMVMVDSRLRPSFARLKRRAYKENRAFTPQHNLFDRLHPSSRNRSPPGASPFIVRTGECCAVGGFRNPPSILVVVQCHRASRPRSFSWRHLERGSFRGIVPWLRSIFYFFYSLNIASAHSQSVSNLPAHPQRIINSTYALCN